MGKFIIFCRIQLKFCSWLHKKRWHTSWKFQLETTSNKKVIAKKPLTNLYEMNITFSQMLNINIILSGPIHWQKETFISLPTFVFQVEKMTVMWNILSYIFDKLLGVLWFKLLVNLELQIRLCYFLQNHVLPLVRIVSIIQFLQVVKHT